MTATPHTVIDLDQHFNETNETWQSVPLPAHRRLSLRENAEKELHLYLGDTLIGPGRASKPDEYNRIKAAVAEDPLAFERERLESRGQPRRFDDIVDPSASDIDLRLEELDKMQTDIAVLFPSYGFYWTEEVDAIDATLVDPHLDAWNTWIAAKCRPHPGRLYAVGQVGFYDVDHAVAEIHRCRELGLKGVNVCMKPFRGRVWSDPENEPIWQAFEDTGLPLFLHITLMRHTIDPVWGVDPPDHSGPDVATMVNRHYPVEAVLTDLVMGGVFERHPRLCAVPVECGAGWLPSLMERLDWAFEFLGPRNLYLRRRLSQRPSEYLKQNLKCVILPFDPFPGMLSDDVNELFLYGSDFPHDEGTVDGIGEFERLFDSHGIDSNARERFYGGTAKTLLDLGESG